MQHTVAIVDDDAGLRKALGRLLSAIGYRPALFASAAEFLGAATSDAACVLIDINLGETLGLDLGRELSAAGFKFPIIFMSSIDDDAIRETCADLGCVAYLRKPFSSGRLDEVISNAIGLNVERAPLERRVLAS